MFKIASYVFFDIETTGLPWQEKNQTKITELSFVAALREDIESTTLGTIPPVSKLTLVFNPQRVIQPEVVKITGLSNELLRHAPIFKQKINSLISFLEDLPKPVCIVAHNGNSFDYKILLTECIDAGVKLPAHLLCVDSLCGFRKLLKGTTICYDNLKSSSNTLHSTPDDLLTDDEDDWPQLNVSNEDWQEIDEICLSLSDISCEEFSDTEQTKEVKNKRIEVKKERSEVIKNVFNDKTKVKESYTLLALYKRLLNKQEDNAHRAEADCLMLLHCVVALKEHFLPWADGAHKLLSSIKPLNRY